MIDDHVLAKYRVLLDAEDEAFDQLEHAYEEGNRDHFEAELALWQAAIEAKVDYLSRMGIRPNSDSKRSTRAGDFDAVNQSG